MPVTVTFEGDNHADIVRQVKEWLATVEGPEHLTPAEAVEAGAGLTKDALRVIAAAAPRPVGDSEIVRSLTEMGYRATDATKERLLDGLARVEELSGGTLVREVRDTGQKAVYEMNAGIAKQILRQLTRG
jgi:hypothetical protein